MIKATIYERNYSKNDVQALEHVVIINSGIFYVYMDKDSKGWTTDFDKLNKNDLEDFLKLNKYTKHKVDFKRLYSYYFNAIFEDLQA